MSTQDHKKLRHTMIPVELVARIYWNKDFGEKLKTFRGKISRRQFAENLSSKGIQCSHQYLQQIEDGRVETLELALLQGICTELDCSIGDIFTCIYIEIAK